MKKRIKFGCSPCLGGGSVNVVDSLFMFIVGSILCRELFVWSLFCYEELSVQYSFAVLILLRESQLLYFNGLHDVL